MSNATLHAIDCELRALDAALACFCAEGSA